MLAPKLESSPLTPLKLTELFDFAVQARHRLRANVESLPPSELDDFRWFREMINILLSRFQSKVLLSRLDGMSYRGIASSSKTKEDIVRITESKALDLMSSLLTDEPRIVETDTATLFNSLLMHRNHAPLTCIDWHSSGNFIAEFSPIYGLDFNPLTPRRPIKKFEKDSGRSEVLRGLRAGEIYLITNCHMASEKPLWLLGPQTNYFPPDPRLI